MVNFRGPRKTITAQDAVAVIGLGRFGRSVAQELMARGVDVLGIDRDQDRVQALSPYLTQTVQADTTDGDALRQLGVADFSRVVVGIGEDVESSILTASQLLTLGVQDIWVKATSDAQGMIFTQLGIKHVVYPDRDTGKRVAHLLQDTMNEYLSLDDQTAIAIISVPASWLPGRQGSGDPADSERNLRSLATHFNVNLAAVRHPDSQAAQDKSSQSWRPITSDTQFSTGDQILVWGSPTAVDQFGNQAAKSP